MELKVQLGDQFVFSRSHRCLEKAELLVRSIEVVLVVGSHDDFHGTEFDRRSCAVDVLNVFDCQPRNKDPPVALVLQEAFLHESLQCFPDRSATYP